MRVERPTISQKRGESMQEKVNYYEAWEIGLSMMKFDSAMGVSINEGIDIMAIKKMEKKYEEVFTQKV